jgi:hypothetical protein
VDVDESDDESSDCAQRGAVRNKLKAAIRRGDFIQTR